MVSQTYEKIEYTSMEAKIMVITINEINNKYTVKRSSFMETFSLKQGIKKFGQKGYKVTYHEIIYLHQRTCFKPIKVAGLNPIDRKRELE